MSSKPLSELDLIRRFRRRAGAGPGVRVGIGDDCAVLEPTPGARWLATTDLLLEDVHFRRRYAAPGDIGWKALAVNLSDIASMGGTPRWALVALACAAGTTQAEAEEFFGGMLALAGSHEVAVVGGDTTASPAGWLVNVTVLGEVVGAPLLRSGARPGDVIAVTGTLGASGAGLAALESPGPSPLPGELLEEVRRAHLRPSARVKEGQWLAVSGGVNAMIDLSDGLATDLAHVTTESDVGAVVELHRLPIAASTRETARRLGGDALAWATGAGEDYELLLTCDPRVFSALAVGLERATGSSLTAIGQVTERSRGLTFVDEQHRTVAVAPGFEHFVTSRRRG